jgi:hypothetical protein
MVIIYSILSYFILLVGQLSSSGTSSSKVRYLMINLMLPIERAPALMDNALLAFVGPFFFVFEVLALFGYKKKEIREWNKYVEREIDQYQKSRKFD